MNGKPASSSASSIEYPTCVSAPALMITPLAPVDDSWMKSTIEPSWFDWKNFTSTPSSEALAEISPSISPSVFVP